MSSISVNTITDASGGATTSINGFTPTVSNMAGRNRIINGDMRIAQRGTGPIAAVSQTYLVDRWNAAGFNGASCTIEQSTEAPANFTRSLKYTVTTGATTDPTDYNDVRQYVEGLNVADFGWGTVNAKTVTLSFWVRSSLTGTFAVAFVNGTYARCYPASYTINSANTWEYKTVTVAGDTSGTWVTDTSTGLRVVFDLGVGSDYSSALNQWSSGVLFGGTGATKLSATTGATFYITGVQLEAGAVATPFEHRQYGTELALCQRYFQSRVGYNVVMGSRYSTNLLFFSYALPVVMRTTPSVSNASGWSALNTTASEQSAASTLNTVITSTGGNVDVVINSSFNPASYIYFIDHYSTSVPTLFSAEL